MSQISDVPPAVTATRDAIRVILRRRPAPMNCEEVAAELDPQLTRHGNILRPRKLEPLEVYRHCVALVHDGHLTVLGPEPDRDLPVRFMWAPPRLDDELVEAAQFEDLARRFGAGEDADR